MRHGFWILLVSILLLTFPALSTAGDRHRYGTDMSGRHEPFSYGRSGHSGHYANPGKHTHERGYQRGPRHGKGHGKHECDACYVERKRQATKHGWKMNHAPHSRPHTKGHYAGCGHRDKQRVVLGGRVLATPMIPILLPNHLTLHLSF